MKIQERPEGSVFKQNKIASVPATDDSAHKYASELSFWKSRLNMDNGVFKNDHFEQIMLAMAQEQNDGFLKGKVVADFGCGPRGSLVWARSALLRIGIDVLSDLYSDEFKSNIINHGMIYLKSTEKSIPLPTDFIDVMFTVNAIDHVDSFPTMCGEILRVLKSGGDFIGSFNLGEPATATEPQQLDEDMIMDNILKYLHVESYRITNQGPPNNQYGAFFKGDLSYEKGQRGFLWVRGKKIRSLRSIPPLA